MGHTRCIHRRPADAVSFDLDTPYPSANGSAQHQNGLSTFHNAQSNPSSGTHDQIVCAKPFVNEPAAGCSTSTIVGNTAWVLIGH